MNKPIFELNFPKLNHFWMDSGLLGLYHVSSKEQPSDYGLEIFLSDEGISFKGEEKQIQAFLQKSYDRLLKQYYNTSTQKQKEQNAGFFYDTKTDQFIRFPKVKPMGIAGLVKISGQSYKNQGTAKFEKSTDSSKNSKYPKLEERYSFLQDRFEKFLTENKLTPGNSLLLDGKNIISPSVNIEKLSGKSKGRCFICGHESHSLSDIGGTVFPFITGSSGVLSFNSLGNHAEKVCWKCDFIAKFVPVAGYYTVLGDSTHIYFPYSASLEKMNDVFRSLDSTKKEDPNLLKNFNNTLLGGNFQKPYELFFTFLYSLYRVVMTKSEGDSYELDYEALLEITLNKAPVDFFVIVTESLGDAQMGKVIWSFHESVYIFRLFDYLERNKIDLKRVMTLLIEFNMKPGKKNSPNKERDGGDSESNTIIRNRIIENILKKHSIVSLVEQHAFRINKSEIRNIKPLNDFVILYEKTIREGDMTMDQKIIDVAVSVGKTIGMSIAPSGKKGKGDLFRLRKTRKPEDFLNEINRIQMKYGTRVNADLYNEGQKMEDNFMEFKQFCMIAALNTYNAGNPVPVEVNEKPKTGLSS